MPQPTGGRGWRARRRRRSFLRGPRRRSPPGRPRARCRPRLGLRRPRPFPPSAARAGRRTWLRVPQRDRRIDRRCGAVADPDVVDGRASTRTSSPPVGPGPAPNRLGPSTPVSTWLSTTRRSVTARTDAAPSIDVIAPSSTSCSTNIPGLSVTRRSCIANAAKLASLDCRRHSAVLPNPAYTPVPIASTSAIAVTAIQCDRRSRHDQRSHHPSRPLCRRVIVTTADRRSRPCRRGAARRRRSARSTARSHGRRPERSHGCA